MNTSSTTRKLWASGALRLESIMEQSLWEHPRALLIVMLVCALPAYCIITVPLQLQWQLVFAIGCFLAANWLSRYEGKFISVMLMVLSLLVSSRYLYWRFTESVNFSLTYRHWYDNFFAIGLLAAEVYAYLVLVLGYFQVLWPLHRKPLPMPDDMDLWPSVDIYIPTYNEPMKVVRPTVLAALSIDWPRDKLNVYVLDDGRRQEFREFCETVGATHITRSDSKHAKAGNLNRAMQKTNGEFIAIFDCDHVPTRSFLQVTIGWFLKDPRLAMLQTPHHFFSPDPFERNLGTFRKVPNEGELFYGLLQDGNDLWNATFFCGSCAVLRRTALMEVGGIAVETVTEDAHTALKMHRLGWNTAYINLAQAAGLATESLSAHVGQRIRWARGMAQIFRIDNPLLGKGLRLSQRLCYVNAMAHFFYGMPRIVFLTAPLAYLFFQAHIIEASALAIVAYAAPHIVHSNLTNSRLQGAYRHSFWAEVYETVLATYILVPTTLALINPKLGSFNVTAKGGLIQEEYFDSTIAKPYLVLLFLNLAGLFVGIGRFIWWNTHELDTVVLNIVWTIYNLIIIGAALSVAWESRQVRKAIRVSTEIPAKVRVGGTQVLTGRTIDLSEGGVGVQLDQAVEGVAVGEAVEVALSPDFREVWIPCKTTRAFGRQLAVRFEAMNLAQENQLIYALFGRANAWVDWAQKRSTDDIGASFGQIVDIGIRGGVRMARLGMTAFGRKLISGFQSLFVRSSGRAAAKGSTAAMVALMTAAVLFSNSESAHAQDTAPQSSTTAIMPNTLSGGTTGNARELTLQDLGIQKPIRLRGVQGEIAIPIAIRDDEIVTGARLHLRFSHSPSLIFPLSHLNVLVNNELAATIPLSQETASGAERVIDIDPRLFVEYNNIGLQLIAHYTMDCEDPVHTTLWAIVSNQSTIELQTRPLQLANDLNILPQPFFDSRDSRQLTLPFVFTAQPSQQELEAAGVVASWFGALASYRRVRFPVYINELPPSNAVVFAVGGKLPTGVNIDNGTRVSMVDNPAKTTSKLLVISGNDGTALNMAARALALGKDAMSGESVAIRDFKDPEPRKPYDAPRWIPTDRPVEFGELSKGWSLEVSGLYPDSIRLPFHIPPDLFTWRSDGMKLDLKYRYTPTVGPKSTLNVNINDEFVQAIALSYTDEDKYSDDRINLPFTAPYQAVNEAKVNIPDYKFSSDNVLQFQYYFERKKEGACKDAIIDNLRGAIDSDSTIDLSDLPHYTYLPELSLFANAGFPFTRMADLSDTGIVLPDQMGPDEIEAYLITMGHFGSATGYPAIRFKLATASTLDTLKGKDLLVFSESGKQPLLEKWADDMPLTTVNGVTRLSVIGPVERLRARWSGRDVDASLKHAGQVIEQAGHSLAALMSFESPLDSGKTVVFMTAGDGQRLVALANALTDSGKTQFVRGDMVLLNGDEVNAYTMGGQYAVGKLPLILGLRWWLSNQPLLLVLFALLAAALISLVVYRMLRRMAQARKEGHG